MTKKKKREQQKIKSKLHLSLGYPISYNNNNNNYLNTRNVPLVVPFLKVHGYVPYSMLTLEFTSCYTTVSASCNIIYNSALCSIEIPLKAISALNLTSGYSVHQLCQLKEVA